MISLSHEEFQKSIVKDGGFEVYTQEQFNTWIEDNEEVLQKGERGTLEDFEVPEYDILKAELASFVQIEVINPSTESQFRIEKSTMYIRPKQVEWDEPELIKGEDGTEIIKARSGRYTNTPTNRKLGRVGQKYGGEKTDVTSPDKEKIKEGFKNPHGMNISNDPETRQAVAEHTKDHIKKLHEERKAKQQSSNSTGEGDDKGKSEKKQPETKRSIKELEDLHPSEMSFKEFERLQGSKGDYNGSDMERSVLKRVYDKKVQEKK